MQIASPEARIIHIFDMLKNVFWALRLVTFVFALVVAQVIRDSKTKISSAGVPFTTSESSEGHGQACEFLRSVPSETPAAKKRRLAKAVSDRQAPT